MTARAWMVRLGVASALLGAIAGIAVVLQRGSAQEEGPRPIVWGQEACAHCRMHISDPRYAAQLVTHAGDAASFDDPGCLFLHLAALAEPPADLYFRHASADRWLRAPDVAFVQGGPTPMGFDLMAVEPGASGVVDLAEATRRVRARRDPHAQDTAAMPGAPR